ncbi:MAG: hypothetical protein CEN87_331 [Parcubacteria group bacterium Licking1014_1]|nr:MAG: hypothetical protein CEN87_331 [Parcubacteria group bacterium Licking1014_1]
METSQKQNIIISWFLWCFYEMPRFLIQIWRNYLLFGLNYFSVPLLFKTLFSPWRRYRWNYPKSFDIKEFFNTLISNSFSMVLGAMCRIVLIIIGILGQVVIFSAGLTAIILWILAPFIIIGGIWLIFTI